jgi:hypothetical protein
MNEQTHDFTADEDSEYMNHIMYVKPGDPNSETVIARINQLSLHANIFIHDATKSKPKWLRGVPTMVSKEKNVITERVSNILPKLDEMSRTELSSGVLSGGLGCASFSEDMFSIEGDPAPGPVGRNEKSKRKSEMESSTNSAVESLRNSRDELDQRIQRSYPGGPPARQMPEQRQPPSHPFPPRRSAW